MSKYYTDSEKDRNFRLADKIERGLDSHAAWLRWIATLSSEAAERERARKKAEDQKMIDTLDPW